MSLPRIEIADYDPTWPDAAAAACEELTAALPGLFHAIEHIGSTAVPGLPAKPVIDLMAAVTALDLASDGEPELEELGYAYQDTGMPNRLFYARDNAAGRRTHHLHVVTVDTWETRNERLLRDHLRTRPEAAAEYGALKRRLAAEAASPEEYTRRKTALVQRLVDAERAARGLPLVPVWEA